MTLEAAAAASFATSVGAKAGDPLFGHKGRGSGGMEERGVSEPVGFAIAVFLRYPAAPPECERAAMLITQPVWGPATQPGPHERRHWVRDEALPLALEL